VMPVDEEERLIHHMCECAPASIKSKGDWLKIALILLLATGCRPIEACIANNQHL
jgi:hypothetical protein